MLTRLKTEMLVRQKSMINQVSHSGVPSNNLRTLDQMILIVTMMMLCDDNDADPFLPVMRRK